MSEQKASSLWYTHVVLAIAIIAWLSSLWALHGVYGAQATVSKHMEETGRMITQATMECMDNPVWKGNPDLENCTMLAVVRSKNGFTENNNFDMPRLDPSCYKGATKDDLDVMRVDCLNAQIEL